MEFCFYIYDLNGDGYISRLQCFSFFFIGVLKNQNLCTREEMLTLMKGSLFIQIEEDGLEDRDDGVKVEKDPQRL